MKADKEYGLEEIAKHNNEKDCWVAINGNVYNFTDYLQTHPSGSKIILSSAGEDATRIFEAAHDLEILKAAEHYKIGTLNKSDIQIIEKKDQAFLDKKHQFEEKMKTYPPLDNMINVYDFQKLAMQNLSKETINYYFTAAADEVTFRENELGFQKVWLKPRILTNVADVSTKTPVLGKKLDVPLFISPAALAHLAHPDAELAILRATANRNILYMISTFASVSIDKLYNNKSENQALFFQLCPNNDRVFTEKLIVDAERGGAKAIIVTVDVPVTGQRESDWRQKITTSSDLEKQSGKNVDQSKGFANAINQLLDPTVDWDTLKHFMSLVKIPFMLKGVQTVEDAFMAYDIGIKGIVISNHGGRQLEYARSTIEILDEISTAFKQAGIFDKIDLYIDGGVRRGSDIFKAIALGAKAVGIGRPYLFGLGTYGQEGIEKVIEIFQEELRMCMRLMGCKKISDIKPEMVVAKNLHDHVTLTPASYLGLDCYEALKHASKL